MPSPVFEILGAKFSLQWIYMHTLCVFSLCLEACYVNTKRIVPKKAVSSKAYCWQNSWNKDLKAILIVDLIHWYNIMRLSCPSIIYEQMNLQHECTALLFLFHPDLSLSSFLFLVFTYFICIPLPQSQCSLKCLLYCCDLTGIQPLWAVLCLI